MVLAQLSFGSFTCEGIMGTSIGTKMVNSETRPDRMGNLEARVAIAGVLQQEKGKGPFLSRRREARCNDQRVCGYGICESTSEESLSIEQGEAYCLNRSEHGVLIFIGSRLRTRQLVELHVAETRWEHSLNLYEVQWTKAVPVESHGHLFLAGCRLVLGASRYWSF
jgi:hypothetical protein